MRRIAVLAAWALWMPLYGGAIYLGLHFYFDPEQVATLWPASGLFLGILVVRPYREWPLIVLLCATSQFLADYWVSGRPLLINAIFSLSNSLEPLLGAAFLRWIFAGPPNFWKLRDVLATAAVAIVLAPVATAVIGAGVVTHYYGASYPSALQIWWAADALGILAVAPVVIQGATAASWNLRAWPRPSVEGMVVFTLTLALSLSVFVHPAGPALSVVDYPYVLFPPLIWAALRLSPRAVSTLGLLICGVAVVATDQGQGPFMRVGDSIHERVLAVQAFLTVTLLSTSVLCAVVWERRETEHRRAALEDQLRQSQKMEAFGQLAGGIAHDFNNLLMVIQANLDLIAHDLEQTRGGAGEITKKVHEANTATDRAAALVRQLLIFSRRHPVRRESLDLGEIIIELQPMLRRVIGEHIELRFHTEESLPKISVDRTQMQQVVMNLVINARDAMANGGYIDISTSKALAGGAADAARPRVRLSVTDNGEGISPDFLPHIFEPFYTTKEVGKGTGLGLATVHGIVSRNEGSIEVDSIVGQGTRFVVEFPAAATEVFQAPRPAVRDRRGNETILVCEDDAAVRPLLKHALEEGGYRVLVAEGAEQALELAASEALIDLLVTDVVMPGLSGRQLAERVIELHENAPALFISGYPADELHRTDAGNGDLMLLEKPFRAPELRKRVRQILDAPR